MAALIALALSLAVSSSVAAATHRCGRTAQAPRAATDHQLRTSVLCLINVARKRRGIAPLSFNRELRRSATAHSRSMVKVGSLTHYGPSGSTLTTRVARSGYLAGASSYRLAENIGAGRGPGNGSPLAIVRDWMRSAYHRRNMLDRGLRDFGVGVARGDPFGGRGRGATYTLDLGSRR